ncbi:VOC family protein [Aeromicrobium duanguangcaii]|uniref:VOC family protein n=1 Tax=Aeromicrobium duanguangcaii TaxID=2968086 RepID=UPI002016DF39|nr:VOC family protein [Aeromicrobium duanguangcaii]MCL3837054.1 VOC family protein [Aeromicrobium duanguangcaii]
MDLVSVRIITANLDSMVAFYEQVTGVAASRPAPVFAELRFASCTLALGDVSTAALFNNAAEAAANRSAIIEWIVDDVDAEFERLRPIVSQWEQEPTQMPWGNRSILFRDPDGNLVNLFTPVTPEAIQRLSR